MVFSATAIVEFTSALYRRIRQHEIETGAANEILVHFEKQRDQACPYWHRAIKKTEEVFRVSNQQDHPQSAGAPRSSGQHLSCLLPDNVERRNPP